MWSCSMILGTWDSNDVRIHSTFILILPTTSWRLALPLSRFHTNWNTNYITSWFGQDPSRFWWRRSSVKENHIVKLREWILYATHIFFYILKNRNVLIGLRFRSCIGFQTAYLAELFSKWFICDCHLVFEIFPLTHCTY